ncbi:thrombopoietin [Pseudoliparis swirei]|uniref:thrombopoietin n=1 Tax=Pseudoliparis swirei TaxID=2059687 RepID=UPI0024BEC44A|nr:thrombopoietin [Pseudoliparis swirei]
MEYSRLLLLVGLMSSVPARPADFWCHRQARKNLERSIEGLSDDLVTCVGADTLPSPVQLPCVQLHATEWANTTLHHKRAEVLGALRLLLDGVQGARTRSRSSCQTSLLGRLERHITNYVAIVGGVHIRSVTTAPPGGAVQNCSSVSSTGSVLKQYGNLLRGKLERLAVDLRDLVCRAERGRRTAREGAADGGNHRANAGTDECYHDNMTHTRRDALWKDNNNKKDKHKLLTLKVKTRHS